MVGRANISTASKPRLLIGITYEKEISLNKKDRIEQYYFMYAADKYDYDIDYIWSKVGTSREYNQIRSCNDKRFDLSKK